MKLFDKDGSLLTMEEWGVRVSDPDYKRVALTEIGDSSVSTVWLGINYRFGGDGPPLIFETMPFGGPFDQEPFRSSTVAEAQRFHDFLVSVLARAVAEGEAFLLDFDMAGEWQAHEERRVLAEFQDMAMAEHHHEHCEPELGIHVVPHRGCILRSV